MKRLLLTALAAAASTSAFAHTSSVPHRHPHEVSILPDLSAMLLAALIVACAALVILRLGRKS